MRTLREILGNPKDSTHLTGLNLISAACSYYPNEGIRSQVYSVIRELETLVTAPAPDVNAALMANEECQEILAEVKTQNGVLLDALKEVRLDLENRTKGDFDALSPRVQVLLVDAIANAETSQQPAPALTPREEDGKRNGMKHIGLFSGIGGFELAAKWAGFETVQMVEIDPFCQSVLAKNFPGVPIHGDITEFDGKPLRGRIDLITGGNP